MDYTCSGIEASLSTSPPGAGRNIEGQQLPRHNMVVLCKAFMNANRMATGMRANTEVAWDVTGLTMALRAPGFFLMRPQEKLFLLLSQVQCERKIY